MDRAALLGLVIGAGLGGLYAGWQLRSLRRVAQAPPPEQPARLGGQMPAAMARLAFLVVALVLVVTVPVEVIDRRWLTGALLVCYSAPLFWRLKQLGARNR